MSDIDKLIKETEQLIAETQKAITDVEKIEALYIFNKSKRFMHLTKWWD